MSIKVHNLSMQFLEYFLYSLNILNEKYTYYVSTIYLLFDCVTYLGYVYDLQYLKAPIFAYFGTPRLVQNG